MALDLYPPGPALDTIAGAWRGFRPQSPAGEDLRHLIGLSEPLKAQL